MLCADAVRSLLFLEDLNLPTVSPDTSNTQTSESTDADAPEEASNTPSDEEVSQEEAAPDAANGEAAEDEADDEVSELEALRAERDEINERLLRTAAELDNYRRRAEREKKRRHKAGKVEVIRAVLEVLDDFERSMDAAEQLEQKQDAKTAYESLRGGVEMVFKKFQDTLGSLGVEHIDAKGEPFDENLHEAMMSQPTEDAEPGTVIHEVRSGYTLGDRVVRHSRVIVAAEPSDD